jgi:hypothetical protein
MTDIYTSEVLMQLFVHGPTWDGNIVSKADRDALKQAGLVDRWNGWNYLTQEGVEAGVAGGLASGRRGWRGKASRQ